METGFNERDKISLQEVEDALRYHVIVVFISLGIISLYYCRYHGCNAGVYRGLVELDPRYKMMTTNNFKNLVLNNKWK